MKELESLEKIFAAIQDERVRQDAKWGPQSHPSVLPGCDNEEDVAWLYNIPTETMAKKLCESSFEANEGSWAHILLEEFAEVVCAKNDNDRRTELIQTAAVCCAWIADLDRKAAAEGGL